MLADHPNILIFKKRHWGSHAYSLEESHIVGHPNFFQSTLEDAFRAMPRQPMTDIDNRAHHTVTTAPVEGVKSATVFNPPNEDFCRGILLTYKNGAQRSLGECRLGQDDSVTVEGPLFIEILDVSGYRRIKESQHGTLKSVSSSHNVVIFHSTYSKQKEYLKLQRIGKKYLRWHDMEWKNTGVEVLDEDD